MKKLNYLLLAPAALMLASCSQDAFEGPVVNGNGKTSITIKLPSTIGTRADEVVFGNALAAENLHMAVFDPATTTGTPVFVYDAFETFNGQLSTEVELDLVSNKDYTVVFFAQAPASEPIEGEEGSGVYVFDAENATLTVNYGNMNNDGNLADAYDCFYAVETITGGELGQSVTLYRPVAQICWGATPLDELNDKQAAAIQGAYGQKYGYLLSNLVVSGINNQLNLLTGVYANSSDFTGTTNINGMAAPFEQDYPAVNGGEPGAYTWIASQFVLVSKATADLTLDITNSGTIGNNSAPTSTNRVLEVNGAPIEANYQTLIYGNLFTENTSITVEKSKGWNYDNNPPYEIEYGTEVAKGLFLDSENKVYTITTANGLAAFATIANNNYNSSGDVAGGLGGYTVLLAADINMQGQSWTPQNMSDVTFDGQGHTISNLTVTKTGAVKTGLFAELAEVTVKDIIFENANITGQWSVGALAGSAMYSTITGITVNNSKVTTTPYFSSGSYINGINAGAVVGVLDSEPSSSLTNCNVSGCTISAYGNVGGLAGLVMGAGDTNTNTVTGNNISDTNVYAVQMVSSFNGSPFNEDDYIGEVYGATWNCEVVTNPENTTSNVKIVTYKPNDQGQIEVAATPEAVLGLGNIPVSQYAGKTFTLTGDVDFEGVEITPIIFWNSENPVTFDGGGYTIKNLTLGDNATSLFGNGGSGCTMNINNLKVDGIEATGNTRFSGLVSNLYGTMTGVEVTNANITANEGRVGILIGIHSNGNLIDCSVSNSTISGTWSVGGLSGAIVDNKGGLPARLYSGCSVTNVELTHPTSGDAWDYFGLITGDVYQPNVTFTNCTMTDCKINGVDSDVAIYNADYSFMWNGKEVAAGIPDWTTILSSDSSDPQD